jgi:uncharacterized membrane protein
VYSRIVLIALLGAVLTLISSTAASAYSSAPMNFCNKTSKALILAYAYHSPGVSDPADHSILTGPFLSQGWRRVDPQKCTTVSHPFDARYIFWFSYSAAQSQSEADGNYNALKGMHADPSPESICVTDFFGRSADAFTFEDENESVAACDKAGGSGEVGLGKTYGWGPTKLTRGSTRPSISPESSFDCRPNVRFPPIAAINII